MPKREKKLDEGWSAYQTAVSGGYPQEVLKDMKNQLDEGEAEYQDGLNELECLKEPTVYALDYDSNSVLYLFQSRPT